MNEIFDLAEMAQYANEAGDIVTSQALFALAFNLAVTDETFVVKQNTDDKTAFDFTESMNDIISIELLGTIMQLDSQLLTKVAITRLGKMERDVMPNLRRFIRRFMKKLQPITHTAYNRNYVWDHLLDVVLAGISHDDITSMFMHTLEYSFSVLCELENAIERQEVRQANAAQTEAAQASRGIFQRLARLFS